jgi:GNAT superfamily N-acetyltransferase
VAALASLLFAQHAGDAAHFALLPGREGELRDLMAGILRDPSHRLLVAEAPGGSLLGFAAFGVARRPGPFAERERGEIDWLFVREEARRRGTGRALAGAALDWLRERGVARVEIRVARANAGGLAFWRALGFAPSMDVLDLHL